jgi:hypothetical protein
MVTSFDWENRVSADTGFVCAAKFSKPIPHLIYAGGAGKNEIKIFENNPDGSQMFKQMAAVQDFDCPVLSIDVCHSGQTVAAGLQNGTVCFFSSKISSEA